MPHSGLTLQAFTLSHPEAARLQQALAAISLEGIAVVPGPAALSAQLDTPQGPRTTASAS
jgi:hypothetical protein